MTKTPVDPFPLCSGEMSVCIQSNVEASDRFENIRFSLGSCYVSEGLKHGEFGFRLKPRRSAAVAAVFSKNVRFCQLPVTRLLGLVAQSGTFAS